MRQIAQEGWSLEHDDAHVAGDLVAAGACYAAHCAVELRMRHGWEISWRRHGYALRALEDLFQNLWPFGHDWWKPRSAERDMVRAGGLILAEMSRHARQAASKPGEG